MVCKYFIDDTSSCSVSKANSFIVWFQPRPDLDFQAMDDLGYATRVHRVIGSFNTGQFDVCPLQGESDGVTTCCPLYKGK
jgi:hypothetical protein